MRWLNYIKEPNFEVTITVFQALILLAEKYRTDKTQIKTYELIKKLCLSGIQTPQEERLLNDLLNDKRLSRYRISSRKEDINQDPVRRYFESQLSHKTLLTLLDTLDMRLLEGHLYSIINRLPEWVYDETYCIIHGQYSEEWMNKYSEDIFSLNRAGSYQSFKPQAALEEIASIALLDERKKKMRFLAGCLYAARKEIDCFGVRGTLLMLRYQKNGVYDDTQRARARKKEDTGKTQSVYSNRMGNLSFVMPLPFDDDLLAERVSSYTRSVDKFAYVGQHTLVQNKLFSNRVSPFVGSISGTILIELNMMSQLLKENRLVYQFKPNQLKLFLKLFIACMLYQAGGHSFLEYTRVLQLPEVQAEFKTLPVFSTLTLDSLFRVENEFAFNLALDKTISYNHHLIQVKKLHAELEKKARQKQHQNLLGSMTFFSGKNTLQYVIKNHSILGYVPLFLLIMCFDEKRLSDEKAISIRHTVKHMLGILLLLVITMSLGDEIVNEQALLGSQP